MKNNLQQLKEKIPEILPCVKKGYIVGGAVRDALIGKRIGEIKDIDIIVHTPIKQTIDCIKKLTQWKGFLYKKGKPVFTLYNNNLRIDITELQNTITEDLYLRDFTVNAIAFSIQNNRTIDPFNGVKDLKRKLLKPVSDDSIKKDPVRILRGIRIKNQLRLRFSISFIKETLKWKNLLKNESAERIKEELIRILHLKTVDEAFLDMRNLEILYAIFPELRKEEEIPPSGLHQYPLIIHTINTIKQLRILFENPDNIHGEILKEAENMQFSGSLTGKQLLILTALLHDAGKPLTVKEKDGRLTFYNHDKAGKKIAQKCLLRLGFGKKAAISAGKIIELHLRPHFLFQLHKRNNLSQKAVYRFIKDAGSLLPLVIIHSIADYRATSEQMEALSQEFACFLNEKVIKFYLRVKSLKPLLSGREIMTIKSTLKGKGVGKVKDKLFELQALGIINSKEDAIKAVKGINP
ncbi:HD domain-containing protein [Desulfurobacterium sp.]